ncbi:hypothetical protein, partial [Staphylococcus aureus]|uniref:hypothetical protein n=1 Tax=Staphylococcus aureus TaxID=1280 RepID=UPI0038B3BCE6
CRPLSIPAGQFVTIISASDVDHLSRTTGHLIYRFARSAIVTGIFNIAYPFAIVGHCRIGNRHPSQK